MIASPVFFYTVSAHVKALMDRCQSLWVKKYWIDKTAFGMWEPSRKGLVVSVGATRGKKLFDGMLLTMKYFFDTLDMELWDSLLFRQLDLAGDVEKHPEYLDQAYERGRPLSVRSGKSDEMEFRPVALEDQGLFKPFFSQCPSKTSDYSFVNLWSWADAYGLEWALADDLIWLRQRLPESSCWAPIGDWRKSTGPGISKGIRNFNQH